MIEFDFAALSLLGLTSTLVDRATACPMPIGSETRLARIIEVHRESVRLHDGGVEHGARVLPRLARALADDDTALAVGDWVLAAADAHGGIWVHERIPPLTHIARRDSDGRRHPVVSNVDTALLVMGLDDDFNPRRLERYLALVHRDGIMPVVVLTKVDVAAPTAEALAARMDLLRARIPKHIDVLAVNATDASAASALAPYLQRGQTLVALGSSGAGKSTLINSLLGAHVQDTGPVRANDGRGKHTTTARSLHRLPHGACVIDTPGLRTLRPDADETALAGSFSDVEALAGGCRFRDCRHIAEPGCAVREGLDADRLRNYHKLVREVRRDTLTVLDRQRLVAEWKARGRAAKVKLKAKRGDV
jgi:ribosome biogenesis GTPase